jgi:hypothetical protein
MLPGIRFLFAAIVLSVSIAVFGFGAAALFRSAHEEFANDTAWRPAPETRFAEAELTPQPAAPPVLAMLSVDEPAKTATKATTAETAKAEPLASPPAPAEAVAPAPAESEKTAALQPTDPVPPAPAKPDLPVSASPAAEPSTSANAASSETAPASPAPAIPVASETTPAAAEAPAVQDETRTATAEPPSAPLSDDPSAWPPETFDPAPNQSSAAETHAVSSRIATLGGPPVIIEQPGAKAARARAEAKNDAKNDAKAEAKPDAKEDAAAAKRLRAKRLAAAHRRRIAAARARATQQASQMEQPLPFGPATAQVQPAR